MGDQGPLTLMSSVGSPVHPPAPIQDRCVGTRAPGGMGLDLVRAASASPGRRFGSSDQKRGAMAQRDQRGMTTVRALVF